MADEGRSRPVSGEIMADAPAPGVPAGMAATRADAVDADYEVVSPNPRDAAARPFSMTATAATPPVGMDMLRRARGDARPAVAAPAGPMFWLLGVGLAALAFWVSGGHALMRSAPFLAQTAPAPALRISAVTSRIDASGPNALLFVDGEAANDGSTTEKLPPLAIIVLDNNGRVIRYKLGTGGRAMAPGERFAFSSRLDVPKNGVKTVSVTFGE